MAEKIIRLLPSGKEVLYKEGDSVLSALERSGYALPSNCRAGACGECKMKVISGEYDQGFILDMALSPEDKEQGYGLMCMAKLKSDCLEVEWADSRAMPKLFPPQKGMEYVLIEKNMVTPTIVKLRFRSLRNALKFWPGQFVKINDKANSFPARCYSISSVPNPEGEMVFHITRKEGGKASTWFHDQLKVGDTVLMEGPYGRFVGDPSAETPVLCLAAGSGLAPILSLSTAAMLRGGFKYPAHILFSAKTKDEVLEEGMFRFLEKKFPNFKYDYTLTREKNPNGLEGRIPDLLSKLYPNLSKHSIYICGGPDFVRACKDKVRSLGAKEELLHFEEY